MSSLSQTRRQTEVGVAVISIQAPELIRLIVCTLDYITYALNPSTTKKNK